MKLTSSKSIALGVVLSAIFMGLVANYWPIQDAYHPLNVDWNGCSDIIGTAQNATILATYAEPLPNGISLLAIVAPSKEFRTNEASALLGFVKSGGILMLADDAGSGNSLLRALNVSVRFEGNSIADLLYYSIDTRFPVVVDFSPSPITANVSSIILNHPSYLEIQNSSLVQVLAHTSPFSFIDHGTHKPSSNETLQQYPVIAETEIGRGKLVLIADPRMFTNEMIEVADNMHLFRNLLNLGGGDLLFDTAHLAAAPLTDLRLGMRQWVSSTYILFSHETLYMPILLVIVLALGVSLEAIRLGRRRRTHE